MPETFLDYAPVSLGFGTSGLRGLVRDITDLEAYINVKGCLRYLSNIGDVTPGAGVVLAGDLRPSTERIMGACAQAIRDGGFSLENAGRIPTPALVLRSVSTRRAGVMVSGSHIPFDRNGIKLNKSVGEILKSDEEGIRAAVEGVRAEEYARTAGRSAFTTSGAFQRLPELPPVEPAAEEEYVGRYTKSFGRGCLSGLRVLVYQHSAVGRDILVRILTELGAEVVPAGRTETFVPIDTENVTEEMLDLLERLVRSAGGGGPLHAVVSTDGDSDRPLMAAVLPSAQADSRGRHVRFLSGDLLGIVVAEALSADAVAVPISANDAVERRMSDRSIRLRKTKIGSPYVVAALAELNESRRYARVVGWEANGGFLLGSDVELEAGSMRALATRDAVLPMVCNLLGAAKKGGSLSTVWSLLPPRFGQAGLIDGVQGAVSAALLASLVPGGPTTEVELDASGRVTDVSGSLHDPRTLSASEAAAWRECKETLARFFTPALGFDAIVKINVLDGVRVWFANGDVAHVRPSGNAPQLRIYANSDSQQRADRIVELGLREPDGILRSMERTFAP